MQYPVAMEMKYKTRARTPRVGLGKTYSMSNRDVTFTTDQPLEQGTLLEISIAWPALLNDRVALQLVVEGEVVQRQGTEMTARILKHHFRTRGPWRREETVQCAPPVYAAAASIRTAETVCAS